MYTSNSGNQEGAHLWKDCTTKYKDGDATQTKHAYGDRQYYQCNSPAQEDQFTDEALLPLSTSA